VNHLCKSINIGGSHKGTACVNGALTQAVFFYEPPVLTDLHRWFLKQITCAILSINTPQPPSSPSGRTVARGHIPLEHILEVQFFENTRGEVLIFISWKEVAKKG